jgi:hypothetical protein
MMKNIKFLISALATLFWFKGMYRILDEIISDKIINNVILVIAALIIFYINNGEFDEIGSVSSPAGAHVPKTKKLPERMDNIGVINASRSYHRAHYA